MFLIILGIVFGFLCAVFNFKRKQAKGRQVMNSIRTDIGHGSFGENVKTGVMVFFYSLLSIICGILATGLIYVWLMGLGVSSK